MWARALLEEILDHGRFCMDLAELGPYRNDLGPLFQITTLVLN